VAGLDGVLTAAITAGLRTLGWPVRSFGAAAAVVLVGDRAGNLPPLPADGQRLHPPRVILIAGLAGLPALAGAVRAGADDALDADRPLTVLIGALDATLRRPAPRSPAERSRLLAALRFRQAESARFDRLTGRERQVLTGLLDGRLAAEIADDLHVSLATVRTQIHQVLTKLEVGSQLAAVALAHRSWAVPLAGPPAGRIGNLVDDRASWLR